jgi:hypothetical protein
MKGRGVEYNASRPRNQPRHKRITHQLIDMVQECTMSVTYVALLHALVLVGSHRVVGRLAPCPHPCAGTWALIERRQGQVPRAHIYHAVLILWGTRLRFIRRRGAAGKNR